MEIHGIDCNEAFSPVIKYTKHHLVLAIVAAEDMELPQMDVKTAFLSKDLDENIFVEQPIEFVSGIFLGRVPFKKSCVWT